MTYQHCSLLVSGLIAALLILPRPVLAVESASAEIDQRAKDPNQWPAPGRHNKLTRHSELNDINTDNVKKLQMIWAQSTGALRGAEGQPIVIGDVGGKTMLFMVSGCPAMSNCNVVQALDLTDPDNPKQVWNYVKKTDRDESAVPRACCDTVNRGLNYAKGKIITHTLDGFVIALDAQTGEELWVVKNAYPEKGETETSPTLIAENLVIAGFGGDEFAARGRMTAYDLDTGKRVWNCHATGSDKDVCLTPDTNKAHPEYGTYGKDLGISTYPNDDWKIGGGAFWGFFSYDPELKLVYSSTGNPGLWSPSVRCGDKTHEECNTGKWDNKWSLTIFARKVDTGEVVWAYQMTPFDQWDYDGVNENMLTDIEIDGKTVKALTHFDRNGFAYVLDRTDGTLLRATPFVKKLTWASGIGADGRPVLNANQTPTPDGVTVCPAVEGATNWFSTAFDAAQGLYFVQALEKCTVYTLVPGVWEAGKSFYSGTTRSVPGERGEKILRALELATGQVRWEVPQIGSGNSWGGVLATAGGVVFFGDDSGAFAAVDSATGRRLWQFQTNVLWKASPMTYVFDGRQYVAVAAGGSILSFALTP